MSAAVHEMKSQAFGPRASRPSTLKSMDIPDVDPKSATSSPVDVASGSALPPAPVPAYDDFLAWEKKTKETVDFKKMYVDMTGDLHAGLLLSQIVYWHLPKGENSNGTKLTIRKEGRLWLAKTDADWRAEVRLSAKQARAARLIIEKRGLITCKTMRFRGDPTTHISINEGAFVTAWAQMMAIPVDVRDKGWIDGSKAKRVGAKRPGSKPASGNRTPRKRSGELPPTPLQVKDKSGDAQTDLVPKNDECQEACHYSKGNNGITEKVIGELLKSQDPDYPRLNNLVFKAVISLTESKTKITAETTAEILSKIKGGGVLNPYSSEKARAECVTEIQSPPAVIAPPENTTTGDTTLQTDTASVRQGSVDHSPTNAPQGAYSAPAVSSSATPIVHERQHSNESSSENVPLAPAVINIYAEQNHDPQYIRTILEPRLGGSSNLGSLMRESPPAVRKANTAREQWLAIPEQRIHEILKEADDDKAQNPLTAIISRLDQEIGAKIFKGERKDVSQTANGGATTFLKPGASKVPVDSDNAMNGFLGLWVLRANPETLVDVVDTTTVKAAEIVLIDGKTLSVADLVTKYSKIQRPVNEPESDPIEEVVNEASTPSKS